MYDDICRFLAEHFSSDFASWLMGESITMTEIKPSELFLEPIRTDALILLRSDESILHIEFQTLPKKNVPFRLLDYRVRVYRKYPDKPMRQVVIYLKETSSDLVQQTSFTMERTRHEFDVIRLWEQPASVFLQYPGLVPFAVLGQSADSQATLRQVAEIVDQIPDSTAQANLIAASGILAGLKLEEEVIYQILRRDIMQESVIYQSIQREGEAKGEARKQREIAINCLRDGFPIEAVARVTGLSIEEVQELQRQINLQN
ncbi:Rpn family recombination-promoting nuclease/putative transposase [Nostoc sp. FACHB-110]|uniref:Rpn family recombination-promoting nuclease/putative transposase n=1 Tax=Nostoc sp. FACHB-110 TaxID=2692834 RepID=UPI00168362AC|nr:Rpn family recombination-promoting nuclease/putative transposase [Nostoc sp. FACHB-110]MBD2440892.1 Rpn family recombination-promoting nuclease/putative transposase [Nostoc sp. FACHB-110]